MTEESERDMLHAELLNAKLCLDTALSGMADSPAERIEKARDGIERALERIDDAE